jgi:hypothetical protein
LVLDIRGYPRHPQNLMFNRDEQDTQDKNQSRQFC